MNKTITSRQMADTLGVCHRTLVGLILHLISHGVIDPLDSAPTYSDGFPTYIFNYPNDVLTSGLVAGRLRERGGRGDCAALTALWATDDASASTPTVLQQDLAAALDRIAKLEAAPFARLMTLEALASALGISAHSTNNLLEREGYQDFEVADDPNHAGFVLTALGVRYGVRCPVDSSILWAPDILPRLHKALNPTYQRGVQ